MLWKIEVARKEAPDGMTAKRGISPRDRIHRSGDPRNGMHKGNAE